MKPTSKPILVSGAAALLALIPSVLHAADTLFTFPVAGGTVQWQTAGWSAGVPSASSRAVIALPSGSTAAGIMSVHYSSLVPNGVATAQALSFTGAGTSGLTLQNNSTGGPAATITVLNLDGSLGAAVPLIEVVGSSNVTINRVGTAADRFLDLNLSGTAGNRIMDVIAGRTLTINSNITESEGAKTLVKTGPGIVALFGTNTYSGGATINAGVLEVSAAGALGTGTIQLNAGGKLGVRTLTINNPISLNGGILGTRTGDATTYAGPVTVTAASSTDLFSYSTPTDNKHITISGKFSSVGAQTFTIAGNLTNTDRFLILTNPTNDFSGALVVNAAQRLRSIAAGGVGNTLGTAQVTFGAGGTTAANTPTLELRDNGTGSNGTLAYGNGLAFATGALGVLNLDRASGANTGNTFALGLLTSNNSTLTVTAANGYKASFTGGTLLGNLALNYSTATDVTFTGGITGSGAQTLTKTGAGVLTLNGTNTYTGLTSNTAGTLNLNGSLAGGVTVTGGALNVNAPVAGPATATNTTVNLASTVGSLVMNGVSALSGIGTVSGSMTIGNGVTINPGNASNIGILHAGNTTFGTTATDTALLNFVVGGVDNRSLLEVGELSVFSGTIVTLKMLNILPTLGFHSIIDYSGPSIDAATFAAFRLAPIANPRINAELHHNTSSNIIELNVLSVDAPRWTGGGNGIWTTATQAEKNWQLILSTLPTDFIAGDEVVFDNTATVKTVTLTAENVAPNKVTFDNSTDNDYTLNGTFGITGTTGLIKTGSGALTINNTNTFTGEVAINGGSIILSTIANADVDSALGRNNVVSFGGGTLNYTGPAASTNRALTFNAGGGAIAQNGTGDLTLAGNLLGVGVFTKTGPGKLILSGTGSTVGGLTISTGTVQIGDGAGGAGSPGSGPLVNNGALIFDHTNAFTMNNTISGSGPITKLNTGNVTLGGTAANTYTGLTTISAGALVAGKPAGVNAIGGNLRIEPNGTFLYVGNNVSNQIADSATVTLDGGMFGDFPNPNPTNPGALDTIATLHIENSGKFGSGRNSLAGGFTITGTTTVTNGFLFSQRGGRINTNTLIVEPAGLVQLDGGATGAGEESRVNVGAGGLVLHNGRVELNSQTATANFTASSLGSIFTLEGPLTSTGTSEFIKNIGISATPTANLNLGTGIRTFNVTDTLNVGSATAPVLVVGTGGIDKTGPGTLRLTGASTFSGGTTVTEGHLLLQNSIPGTGPIVLNANPLVVDFNARFDLTNAISGPGGIEKTNTGELRFTGSVANTYTGVTKVLAGTLVANRAANIIAIPGDLEISAGATFRYSANTPQNQIADSSTVTVNGTFGDVNNTTLAASDTIANLIINGGGIFSPGRNTAAGGVFNPFTITGVTTIAVGGRAISNAGGGILANELRLSGTIDLDGGSVVVGEESYVATGLGGFKLDGGTVRLNSGNLAPGVVATSRGSGVVLFGDVTSVGASSFQRVSPELAPVAVVDLNGEARTFHVTDTMSIGTAALPVVFIDRTPENDGGIVKAGPGTLQISGPNLYGGVTDVTEGILALQGSISGSSVIRVRTGATLDTVALPGGFTVAATQTLSGSGRVTGAVLVDGTIAPGAVGAVPDLATLNFDDAVTFATTGSVTMELSKTGVTLASDRLNLAADRTLTYGGTLHATFTGSALALNDTFNLFDATTFAGDFTAFDLPDLSAVGLAWNTDNLDVNGTISVVPEPTGCALLLGGMSLLAFRRRRQA